MHGDQRIKLTLGRVTKLLQPLQATVSHEGQQLADHNFGASSQFSRVAAVFT